MGSVRISSCCAPAPVPTEESEQAYIFEWAEWEKGKYPELALLHAIPNGGYRSAKTAVMLKRTGVKPGVPDMFLPVARGAYHGLYIELKRSKGGRISDEQKQWLKALNDQGYAATVCYGHEEAIQTLTNYLDLPKSKQIQK
jgi:hypothetical protein